MARPTAPAQPKKRVPLAPPTPKWVRVRDLAPQFNMSVDGLRAWIRRRPHIAWIRSHGRIDGDQFKREFYHEIGHPEFAP